MSTRYHVYASEDDDPDEGGAYEHVKTFDGKGAILGAMGCAMANLCRGRAVQVLPEKGDG